MGLKNKLKNKIKKNFIVYKLLFSLFKLFNNFSSTKFNKSNKFSEGINYNWIYKYINTTSASSRNIIEIGSRDALDAISLSEYLKPLKCFVFEPSRAGISKCINNISKYNGEVEIIFLPIAITDCNNGINLSEFREYIYGGNIGASSLYKWHTRYHDDLDKDKGIELKEEVELLYKVPTLALDSFDFLFEKEIFLIAMDVEGAELNVLQSAKNVLKQTKYICLESGLNQSREGVPKDTSKRIINFLSEVGFKLLAIDNNTNSFPEDNGTRQEFNMLFENISIK